MLRAAKSADPRTGTTVYDLDAPRFSYFESLRLDPWDQHLPTADLFFRCTRKRPLTARQRERWVKRVAFIVEQDLAAIRYAEQCELEDRQTQEYLDRIRNAMRESAEKEIAAEAKGLAHEIVVYERIKFRELREGKGFRKRPSL